MVLVILYKNRVDSSHDDAMRSLLDFRTGVIHDIKVLPEIPSEPHFFQYVATLPHLDRIIPRQNPLIINGGGASIHRDESKLKAIGEAIERYCGCLCFDDEFIFDTYKNLGNRAIDPVRFPSCSEREYKNPKNYLSKPREDVPLGWVHALSNFRQKEVLSPAAYVYLTYQPRIPEEMITLPISTGLACGQSLDDAVLGGLCEVIERDAMMIMWMNKMSVPIIDLEETVTQRS